MSSSVSTFAPTFGGRSCSKFRILFLRTPLAPTPSGPNPCTNHYLLVSPCVLPPFLLGNSDSPQVFWTWAGNCGTCGVWSVECGVVRREMNGLFCSNFASSRPPWRACRAVWCGPCYTAHPDDRFFVHIPTDEDDCDWGPGEDHTRYQRARNGDHLITPFQCDLCVFRNLQHRNPILNTPQDTMLLCCTRQVNLDSLWGRETLTVQATLSTAQHLLQMWRKVRLQPDFPA
jgi:hypothetical protein